MVMGVLKRDNGCVTARGLMSIVRYVGCSVLLGTWIR